MQGLINSIDSRANTASCRLLSFSGPLDSSPVEVKIITALTSLSCGEL